MRLPGQGVATAAWSEAAGGFWTIHGVDFTEPYPPHVHARFVLAVIDQGLFTLQTSDGVRAAPADSIVALNSFRVHGEGWLRGHFRAVFLSEQNLRAVTPAPLGNLGEPAFPNPIFHCAPLGKRLRQFHATVQSVARVSIVEAELSALVAELRAVASVLSSGTRPHSTPVAATRDRLHAGLAELPTIEELARLAGQSPFHYIRTFRNEVGLPPFAYYTQLRIAAAKEWLARGSNLTDVAARLGFCDQSHFTRSFKRSALVPPGVWSRMLRNDPRIFVQARNGLGR